MSVFKKLHTHVYDYTHYTLPIFNEDFLLHSPYIYEATITFDLRRIWSLAGIWNEGIDDAVKNTLKWLVFLDNKKSSDSLKQIFAVVEYQKNKTPHIHMRIVVDEPVPCEKRAAMVAGYQRLYGRATFKDVRLEENYITYLQKDLEGNKNKYGFPHWVCIQK